MKRLIGGGGGGGGGGSGTPGGSTTQIQFNDGGAFGGDAGLTYDKSTDALTSGSLSVTSGGITIGGTAGIYSPGADQLAVSTGGTGRLFINSTGTVLFARTSVGLTTPGAGFIANTGGAYGEIVQSNNGVSCLYLSQNFNSGTQTAVDLRFNNTQVGTISVSSSATSYNTFSDYRLKENVTPVSDGITRLQQLKPARFNFIADPDKTVDGFLAHEVQTIVPEAITGEKDAVDDDGNPVYQGIDQSKLVPLLTAALQEAIGEIESLKARVVALESA